MKKVMIIMLTGILACACTTMETREEVLDKDEQSWKIVYGMTAYNIVKGEE